MGTRRIGLNRQKVWGRVVLSHRICLSSQLNLCLRPGGQKYKRCWQRTKTVTVEKALNIVNDFGSIVGLQLNMKKTKAIWLGKWANNKTKPLDMKWMHTPVKTLGIHFSYDKKGNDDLSFSLKLRKLQTKLDMWSARSLTLFGRVLITKTLGISKIIYSASNIEVPDAIAGTLKNKLFNFIWKKKRIKSNEPFFVKT